MLKYAQALVVASLLLSSSAHAIYSSPLGLSIFPPLQLPDKSFAITGARVSALWGEHANVYGVDLSVLGNISGSQFTGIGISGIFNFNKSSSTIIGLQLAGAINVNDKANIYGLQLASLANVNYAETRLIGLEVSLVNYSPHLELVGVQVGVFNKAKDTTGFQIGLVNYTEILHGIQIGLLNFNIRGLFMISPFLNIGF